MSAPTYTWQRIDNVNQWETLTKQTEFYPPSYPVLCGLVAVGDDSFVVAPLPADLAKKLLRKKRRAKQPA